VRGERVLFSGLQFAVNSGTLLHVAGPNGSGKTSLLRILCGLLPPTGGAVHWQGGDIRAQGDEFRQKLLYIGHANAVKDELTAADNLGFGVLFSGMDPAGAHVQRALGELGLTHSEDLPAKILSQGQRRRVALARLAMGAARPLWILDEPFNALDRDAVLVIRSFVVAHVARGGIVVLTTHQDVPWAAEFTVRIDLGQAVH